MKRIILTTLLFLIAFSRPVKADTEIIKTKATAYCINGKTATGTITKEGRTVASKPEWFNKILVMYEDDGDGYIKPSNYIGTYIVEDTGGKSVRNGYVIDVFIEDYDRAIEFGVKNVLIQVIDSEG